MPAPADSEFEEIGGQPKAGEATPPAAPAGEAPPAEGAHVEADQAGTDGAEGEQPPSGELPPAGEGEEPAGESAAPGTGDEPAGTTPPVKTGGIDKRFAELTRARREAERQAAAEKARADAAFEALARLGKVPSEPAPASSKKTGEDEDPRPEAPVFENPDTFAKEMADYTEKLSGWAARQAIKADRARDDQRRIQEERQRNTARAQQEFQARRMKALEILPDYEDIAENPSLHITEMMASAITVDDKGPEIAYYLGKHPDEAEAIAKLSPGQQLIQIGVVKAKLLAPRSAAPKPRNNLPPPIKPESGQGSTIPKSLDDLDMDSYAETRNARPERAH